ncbi:anti-sigma factor family protein [Phycicoccus avicenniae]|uniref:anti-sigma factor family protein n=1 Tax=Phycicoccus avicenniae TaxID=2828860 RepID=UPI003D27087E
MTDAEEALRGPDHEAVRVLVGPYLLGHLDATDAAALEAHLDTCAACRADLAELTPAAGALAALRGRAPELAEPPADLLERVGAAVATEQRRVRRPGAWRTAGVAAAAAAVAAALTLTGVRLTEPPPQPFEAVPVAVEASGVTASAGVVPHTWGVEVRLTASGFAAGDRYRVVVLGEDGRDYPAGEFVGTGPRSMVCNLNSSVLRADAAGFEVLDADGTVLAQSSFPSAPGA